MQWDHRKEIISGAKFYLINVEKSRAAKGISIVGLKY
jgi:hypothetical protein